MSNTIVIDPLKQETAQCIELLQEEKKMIEREGAREILIVSIDKAGLMNWSFTKSDDLIRLLVLLEATKARVIKRMCQLLSSKGDSL